MSFVFHAQGGCQGTRDVHFYIGSTALSSVLDAQGWCQGTLKHPPLHRQHCNLFFAAWIECRDALKHLLFGNSQVSNICCTSDRDPGMLWYLCPLGCLSYAVPSVEFQRNCTLCVCCKYVGRTDFRRYCCVCGLLRFLAHLVCLSDCKRHCRACVHSIYLTSCTRCKSIRRSEIFWRGCLLMMICT